VLMRVLIEDVREEMGSGMNEAGYDAYEILNKAERLLRDLATKEDWSFLTRHLDPAAKTFTGVRDYPLPDDFGANFVRGSDDGSRYVCKLSDGTGEQHLNYKSPAQFFDSDFEAASNGTPTDYTIQPNAAYYKAIWLDPPPDSNSSSHYTIRGLYKPTFRAMSLDSFFPDETGSYVLWGVLSRFDPQNLNFARDFAAANQALILEEARMRQTRLVSMQGELPSHDGFAPEFQ